MLKLAFRTSRDLVKNSSKTTYIIARTLFSNQKFPSASSRTISTSSAALAASSGLVSRSGRNPKPKVAQARISGCSKYLEVSWGNGEVARYPWVWLRDNCQCPKCFQPSAKARLLVMKDLDVDCFPSEVKLEGSDVKVTWQDGHESLWNPDWLQQHIFDDEKTLKSRETLLRNKRIMWKEDFQPKDIPKGQFGQVLTSDEKLLEFLVNLEVHGIHLLENVPPMEGMIHKLADRVAFLRATNYGREFPVKVKMEPSNLAYTGAALGLHTDLVYYDYMPGVQFLHCIKQAEGSLGGESVFADGMSIAAKVKTLDPEAYDLLINVLVDFHDIGSDFYRFHKLQRRPIIERDRYGEVFRLNYNNQVRDTFLAVPLEQVKPLYKAMKLMDDELNKTAIRRRLKTGDMIIFDNMRILHGREAFSVQAEERRNRLLQGGYSDWDEFRSRIRVLQAQQEGN
ncbi:unnamed protein product [Notodromas monacha]|uniref:Gamma-butyrobetaine dioxygenase n=1 Tax=Notodromas monacha TaxID=399045 RepID=A0A7R9BN20_9CRUS|nr:unnamed protein product [Notodromas monacha]CAG0917145.1 unnamed protein product [Notodromas monacha]